MYVRWQLPEARERVAVKNYRRHCSKITQPGTVLVPNSQNIKPQNSGVVNYSPSEEFVLEVGKINPGLELFGPIKT